ncbi:MAG: hypothetical protein WDM96_18320 [Lacunisphaera sp.]
MDHEGYSVARWFADHGVAGVRSEIPPRTRNRLDLPRRGRSARRCTARPPHRAQPRREWGVDPARLGILGFSAGGELAALAAARGEDGKPDATDPVDRLSSRVAFQGLNLSRQRQVHPTYQGFAAGVLVCGYDDRP